MDLVRRDGVQVDFQLLDIDRDFSCRLHAIGMKVDVRSFGDISNFLDRLNGSDLIIGVHDGNENRVRTYCAANVFWIDKAVGGNSEPGDFATLLLQIPAGVKYRVVL